MHEVAGNEGARAKEHKDARVQRHKGATVKSCKGTRYMRKMFLHPTVLD